MTCILKQTLPIKSKWGAINVFTYSEFSLANLVTSFLEGATAHGLKYLTLVWPGKWASFLLWILAVIGGFAFSFLYIEDLLGESYIIVENGDISTGLNDIQVIRNVHFIVKST